MQRKPGSFKIRSILLIASLVLTVVVAETIIQYDLQQQNSVAEIINIAGKQRMLSQRIAKLTSSIYYNTNQYGKFDHRLDSLQVLVNSLERVHYYLIEKNNSAERSEAVDSLLKNNSKYLLQIIEPCRTLIKNPDSQTIKQAVDQVDKADLPFLLSMEKTVATYQREAEIKLRTLKLHALALGVVAIIIFTCGYVFIILPVFVNLRLKNQTLTLANSELATSEEEIRSNLEQIHVLQTSLEIKQRQYQSLIDEATDMIYELNEEGKFSFINPVLEIKSGFPKEELLGKPYWELICKEDVDSSINFYNDQRKKSQEVSYHEFRMATKSGKRIWVGQNARMFFSDRWIYKVSVVARDITKIKEAETELARKEKLYRLVSENSRDVVSLHSLDGTFEYISPSCIELHGYTPEELIGRNGIEFIFQDDTNAILENTQDIAAKMARNEPIEPSQFRIVTKNRGLVWVENVMKPVFEHGVLTGFQSTVRDISARKAYEVALEEAKQKAEAATVVKSQFLSMMSHEIRTPMNGIIGLTNILIAEKPRINQLENLNLLKFSCNNLLAIINDILDFSKIESGKMSIESVPLSISEIIYHHKKIFDEVADKKGIHIKLDLDGNLPPFVSGDPVRFGQILSNLIGNAVKFTENGFVEVSARSLKKWNDEHLIHFVVRDTGIGIPADKVSAVFEGFNQAATDTTRKFGGTGLGLSITRKLLSLMGSDIKVTSRLGAGSEFSFDIKLREVTPPAVERKGEDVELTKQNGTRLLLVEDNKVNQVVARNFLNEWGFDITIAENGEEAVEKLESMNFDLVLMDIHMPLMDGYEATKIIRAKPDPYFKNISIIALTADVSPEIQEKIFEVGMTDVMSKPFHPRELKAILEKYSPLKKSEK